MWIKESVKCVIMQSNVFKVVQQMMLKFGATQQQKGMFTS